MSAEPTDEGSSPAAVDEPDAPTPGHLGPVGARLAEPPSTRRLFDALGGAALGAAVAAGAFWGLAAPEPTASVPGSTDRRAPPPGALSAGASGGGSSVLAAGSSRPGRLGGDREEGELAERIEHVRRLMDVGAWLGPMPESVEVVVAELSKRWPRRERAIRLRREAAERLLAHALASRYAGRSGTARRCVQLALRWAPALPGARPLLAEIEAKPDDLSDGLDVAPLPTRRAPDDIEPGGTPTGLPPDRLAPDRRPDHGDP